MQSSSPRNIFYQEPSISSKGDSYRELMASSSSGSWEEQQEQKLFAKRSEIPNQQSQALGARSNVDQSVKAILGAEQQHIRVQSNEHENTV